MVVPYYLKGYRMAVRYFQQMGKKLQKLLIKRMTQLGEDAMRYAFELSFRDKRIPYSGTWTHRTHNLGDSFASAVYVDGVLQKETIRYIYDTPQSKRIDYMARMSGRDAVNSYLERIHPNSQKGDVTVIVVAAMYYTKFLEEGTYGRGLFNPKIRVVSGARDYIDRNYWVYTYDIYKRWSLPKPKAKVVRGDQMEAWSLYHIG